MLPPDDDDKIKMRKALHNKELQEKEDEQTGSGTGTDTGTGTGGQGGKVEFYDFLAPQPSRDDLLSRDQLRHLLLIHQDIHEEKVKKGKDKRQLYKDLKNQKIPLAAYRAGLGGSGSHYHNHPVLGNKAQFSGSDPQVSFLPTENNAETNPEQRDELQNELRYRLGYQPTPKFNPKPSPF